MATPQQAQATPQQASDPYAEFGGIPLSATQNQPAKDAYAEFGGISFKPPNPRQSHSGIQDQTIWLLRFKLQMVACI